MNHKVRVVALWRSRKGDIGAILHDGVPVYLASKEKWELGTPDSLRKGWTGDVRLGKKTLYTNLSEKALRIGGLMGLAVPKVLLRKKKTSLGKPLRQPKGDLLKPPDRCWQCKKVLPDGKLLFCNMECGYFWAVTQASVLAALKARSS